MLPLVKTIALRVTKSLFLFVIVHSLLLEFVSDRIGGKTGSAATQSDQVAKSKQPDAGTRFLQSAIWYQTIVNGYRKPPHVFVRVVTLDRNREPNEIFHDFCKQRRFMAALIISLADSKPA